jgi:hypothetical protein
VANAEGGPSVGKVAAKIVIKSLEQLTVGKLLILLLKMRNNEEQHTAVG